MVEQDGGDKVGTAVDASSDVGAMDAPGTTTAAELDGVAAAQSSIIRSETLG